MSRLIDADRLQMELLMSRQAHKQNERENQLMERDAMIVHEQPTVDAVKVVRCKDCIWYHKAHVECNDGTEKDESEFPDEAFGILGRKCGVTIAYGINVGGACENKRLFINDKYQFRNPDGYCSYGEREEGEK